MTFNYWIPARWPGRRDKVIILKKVDRLKELIELVEKLKEEIAHLKRELLASSPGLKSHGVFCSRE